MAVVDSSIIFEDVKGGQHILLSYLNLNSPSKHSFVHCFFLRQSKCLCFVLRVFKLHVTIFCIFFLVVFEEPEDPGARSFFSEIISSISDVRFSHNGRYMLTRDYLTVKVWDLNMENKPMEVYNVHDYLRSKLCSLYENDCIFDKFECVWNGNDGYVMALLLFTFFFVIIFY